MARMERHDHVGPTALRAMQDLATRIFPLTGYHHIGDLAWNACRALDQREEHLTATWTHRGRVQAWGWLELPDTLMLQVDPGRHGIADDVLDWAEQAAPGALRVEIAETEGHLAGALERRGYTRAVDGPFLTLMGRPLTRLPDVPSLPDGYVIRAQRDQADIAGRAAVHRAAFDSTRGTTERHVRMRKTWPYRPEFDLIAVSPEGEAVAYCQGWYDEANSIGEFEPVGTHPDHRRLGLARTVCTAVMHAFAEAGGRRVTVYCRGDAAYPVPKQLYSSMGFAPYARTHTYVGTP